MMRRLCCLLLFALCLPAWGAEEAVVDLRRFLDESGGLQAKFRQALHTDHSPDPQVSEGTLFIKRPGRFRWEYSAPPGQLVVCDGDRIWMYDEDLEQVTVRPVDDTLRGTPAMLLSGQATLDETFEVLRTFDKDGLAWVALRPREGSPEFASLQIGLEGGLLRRMELVDSLGQLTTIELWDVERDADLADDLFAFEPPEGADVIGQGASL
jgi:outer membrane lipoprotein carrier protein